MGKAKAIRPVKAWVAVPTGEPHRLDAGYWLATTRRGIERDIRDHACFPEQWRPAQVLLITPIVRKPKPRKPARRKGAKR